MTPIYNAQAEQEMVACIAHTGAEIFDTLELSVEHFWNDLPRTLFSAQESLWKAGQPVSVLSTLRTVSGPDAARVGGEEAIYAALDFVPADMAPVLAEKLNHCLVARRAQDLCRWTEARLNGWDGQQDGSEQFAADLAKRAGNVSIHSQSENLTPRLVQMIHEKIDRMDRGERTSVFPTSLNAWNNAFGGIGDGQFYAVAGRPGAGKTALMEQQIDDYLTAGRNVLVFEKDMSPQKLIERIACRSVGVHFWKFARNVTNRDERQRIRGAITEIARGGQLHIHSPEGLTADKLCAIARREIRRHGIAAQYLDHIQALQVGRDFREGLTQASLALRRHVTETNIPLVALAHLNREGGKGRPTPSQIKEFDQLFGDVDGMVLLWREDDKKGEPRYPVNFLIGKNREGAETEQAVMFDGPSMEFRNE